MTCKDRLKETGLFSLENAGERREEQSSNASPGAAPRRAAQRALELTARLRLGTTG